MSQGPGRLDQELHCFVSFDNTLGDLEVLSRLDSQHQGQVSIQLSIILGTQNTYGH